MESPSISLVITVYNRERYLASAIESVLVQTYRDFELLIWDDGSSDRPVEIAQHYASIDKRVRVVAATHNGRGLALRDAIAHTTGKYLGWIDSDDLLAPTACASTVSILETQPSVGMVYTNHLIIDEGGELQGLGDRCRIPYSKERLLVDFMTFHFRLMRREVYERVGGIDPDLESAEDYDLCLRLSEATEIVHLPLPLYYYRVHGDSISGSESLKQAYYSELAVKLALMRRGLAEEYQLEVTVQPKFFLRRKQKLANKILGIGLPGTGADLLSNALNGLGIKTIHLPQNLELINDVDGATDLPVTLAYRELDRIYPNSKFILTIRDIDDWLKSQEIQHQKVERMGDGRVPDWVRELHIQCYGSWLFERELWRKAYQKHLQGVRDYFQGRERDLLIVDVCIREGMQELRSFLRCDSQI
jgi:glycosyltransferase involved in cell wall biosynthesis